jgi:hypothetical protein
MTDDPQPQEPANLKFLRLLVTILTGTMIAGLLVIIGLFVIRFSDRGPAMPDAITLPDGTKATAFTQGDSWYAVVTKDNQILIFDRNTGKLTQTVTLNSNN